MSGWFHRRLDRRQHELAIGRTLSRSFLSDGHETIRWEPFPRRRMSDGSLRPAGRPDEIRYCAIHPHADVAPQTTPVQMSRRTVLFPHAIGDDHRLPRPSRMARAFT